MRYLAFIALLALTACAATPESINRQIHIANQGVTVVVGSTDAALLQGTITKGQAQSVSTIAHQVNPLLDSAKAALDASDVAGAERTLDLVNALIAGLKAYVPPSGGQP